MRRYAARPFTLIELIAVMGVMILLAAVAIPAYSSLFSGRKTTLAANKLNGAVLEARGHAVSAKVYTAIVFVKEKEKNGRSYYYSYKSFRLAEVYHGDGMAQDEYHWRRWVPGSSYELLPENTMIPSEDNNENLGTGSEEQSTKEEYQGKDKLPDVTEINKDTILTENTAPAIIFKPNGQLAGTKNKNVVVRFVEANRYRANPAETPKLPLNINWLTCKTKFLDPVK